MILTLLACAGTDVGPSFGTSGTDTAPSTDLTQTFYVSPQGDDGGSGSASQPLATLQGAADVAEPGDTWIIEDGRYGPFVIRSSGEQDAPITFVAATPGGVEVDGDDTWDEGVRIEGDHVVLSGLEIHDFRWAGVVIEGSGNTISEAEIHTIGDRLEHDTNGITGILELPGARQNRYLRNRVHHIGRSPSSPSDLLAQDNAMLLLGDDTLVSNSLFYDSRGGWAVFLSALDGMANATVTNNTFIEGARHVRLVGEFSDAAIQNNLFYSPQDSYESINFETEDFALTNVLVRNNLGFPVGAADVCLACTVEDNLDGVDPGFLDVAGRQVHVAADSAVIDAGTRESAPDADIDGDPRPNGRSIDIGADEAG